MAKRLLAMLSVAGQLLVAPAVLADTPGDYNGDGAVDDADRAIIFAAQGTVAGDAGFVPAADHDGDGVISLVDVSEFSKFLAGQ